MQSNFRYINTKFWDDVYVQNLNPNEKLLFLYFLTNPLTNLIGIFEISFRRIAFDTGFDEKIIETIISKFTKDDKIFYLKGWVFIKNFSKNQKYKGEKLEIAMQKEKKNIPEDILAEISKFRYPIDTLSIPDNKDKDKDKDKDKAILRMGIEDFTLFWKTYPKHNAKEKAKTNFLKLNKTLLPEIITAIQKQKESEQWKKDSGQFIPYPASWLNQKRWEDEVTINKLSEEQEIRNWIKDKGADIAMHRTMAKYGEAVVLKYKTILEL